MPKMNVGDMEEVMQNKKDMAEATSGESGEYLCCPECGAKGSIEEFKPVNERPEDEAEMEEPKSREPKDISLSIILGKAMHPKQKISK